MDNLKECIPTIPKQLDLFFRTLLVGITPTFQDAQHVTADRKVTSMASDTIFNVSHGTVKPFKYTTIGLSLASLTGSKLVLQVLNRAGHSINYNEVKGLEIEFAYSVAAEGRDSPDGILLLPGLATSCVWDNNDASVETLDGKATLHSTVGHTYQNIQQDSLQTNKPLKYREGKNDKHLLAAIVIFYPTENRRKQHNSHAPPIQP